MDRNWNFAMWLAVVLLVALRKESVDRNTLDSESVFNAGCRSPQGERG